VSNNDTPAYRKLEGGIANNKSLLLVVPHGEAFMLGIAYALTFFLCDICRVII